MSEKQTDTVKSAKKAAKEKGKQKDVGEVSRSRNVTSADTVKSNPAASGSPKRAPGGNAEGV